LSPSRAVLCVEKNALMRSLVELSYEQAMRALDLQERGI
jgi:hypothetical protein